MQTSTVDRQVASMLDALVKARNAADADIKTYDEHDDETGGTWSRARRLAFDQAIEMLFAAFDR